VRFFGSMIVRLNMGGRGKKQENRMTVLPSKRILVGIMVV